MHWKMKNIKKIIGEIRLKFLWLQNFILREWGKYNFDFGLVIYFRVCCLWRDTVKVLKPKRKTLSWTCIDCEEEGEETHQEIKDFIHVNHIINKNHAHQCYIFTQ